MRPLKQATGSSTFIVMEESNKEGLRVGRYQEEENTEIHDMVHAANLNPKQLSELLKMFASDMVPKPETIHAMNEEEMQNEI